MFARSFPLHLSLFALMLSGASACQLQRDGMGIIDAGKADRAFDSKSVRLDTAILRDAWTNHDADARYLKNDSISNELQVSPGDGSLVSDSLVVNLDGALGNIDGTASQNQPVDFPSTILTDTASDSMSPTLDASPVDLFTADSVLDSVSFDPTDSQSSPLAPVCDWRLDNTTTLGDLPLLQVDKPSILQTPSGPSICFDGKNDGLIRNSNPLSGLQKFTLQLFFRSDQHDLQEMHLLHIEEPENIRHRFVLETRSTKVGTWYPRVFLRWDDRAMEIDNPTTLFPADRWYWVAFSYDGMTARLFINGVETVAKQADWGPIGDAPLALGMRLNKQGFFPGCFAQLIVSSTVLPATELRVP
jgi:hypothetical protein